MSAFTLKIDDLYPWLTIAREMSSISPTTPTSERSIISFGTPLVSAVAIWRMPFSVTYWRLIPQPFTGSLKTMQTCGFFGMGYPRPPAGTGSGAVTSPARIAAKPSAERIRSL